MIHFINKKGDLYLTRPHTSFQIQISLYISVCMCGGVHLKYNKLSPFL